MKISGKFFDAFKPAGSPPVAGEPGAAAQASARRRVLPHIEDHPMWFLGGRPLPEYDPLRDGFEKDCG